MGTLTIYNDGIYVMTLPAHRYGVGGEIVSRGVFPGLNYARNDIDSNDPKWKRIRQSIQKHANTTIVKKPRLSDHEREYIARQIAAGTYDALTQNPKKLRLFLDSTGRAWSAEALVSHLRRYRIPAITVAPESDFRADQLMQRHTVFVFSERTLNMFGVDSVESLIKLLEKKISLFQVA